MPQPLAKMPVKGTSLSRQPLGETAARTSDGTVNDTLYRRSSSMTTYQEEQALSLGWSEKRCFRNVWKSLGKESATAAVVGRVPAAIRA